MNTKKNTTTTAARHAAQAAVQAALALRQGGDRSMNAEKHYSAGGFEFDLEQLADGMTRDRIDGGKVVISTHKDGVTRELSPRESLINAYFGGEFRDENSLKVSLALTRYFLQTGRQLLPEMVELLADGITNHLKDEKPWSRPTVKRPRDPEFILAVLAISKRFRGKRPEIGAELGGKGADNVKDIIKQAKALIEASPGIITLLHLFEDYMPARFEDALSLLDQGYRDEFIRVNGIKLNRPGS